MRKVQIDKYEWHACVQLHLAVNSGAFGGGQIDESGELVKDPLQGPQEGDVQMGQCC